MTLNIKNPEAHELASELAALTHQSMTQVVTEALRQALEAEKRTRSRQGLAEELLAIGKRTAPHVAQDLTSVNHGEELFDDQGLPA